jgi:hypothetical protein
MKTIILIKHHPSIKEGEDEKNKTIMSKYKN